jgi:hypothetical protein
MFEYVRFRYHLWHIEREKRKASVQFDKDYAEAKKRGDTEDEITSLESGAMEEYYESEDEVRKLYTQYLVREAHRLMLPGPDRDDASIWEHGLIIGGRHLNAKGIDALRATIRAEKKARHERLLMWVPGITGILGTLIGLLAILMGRK